MMDINEVYKFMRGIMPNVNYFHFDIEVKVLPTTPNEEDRVQVKCSIWHTEQTKFYHGPTWEDCVRQIKEQLPQDVAIKKLLCQEVSDGELKELRKLVEKEWEENVPF